MKISEILTEAVSTKRAIKNVEQYVCYASYEPKLPASVKHLMKKSEFAFSGAMYRGLGFPAQTFQGSPQEVIQRIPPLIRRNTGKEVFAWSQSIGSRSSGMFKALWTEISNGHIEPQGIVIQQTGTGVDVNAALEDSECHADWALEEEEEVLAPAYNNVKLVGFFRSTRFFELDRLQEFMQYFA